MLDLDTFVTALYVAVDTIDQTLPPTVHPGPAAGLCRSEVLTLAIVGQWAQFPSERAFWRFAQDHLRPAFPHLPSRPQFNRLLRQHHDALAEVALALAVPLQPAPSSYEILDGTGIPVRNARRRGRGGWQASRMWVAAPGSAGIRGSASWSRATGGADHRLRLRPSVQQ